MSEEVLERQKQFLKVAIGEARQREFTRIKKLQNITSQAQRDVLDARFEAERALDQSRIQNLTQEFEVMKSKVGSGDLQSLGALRAEVPQHLRKMNKHQPYRFAGVENYEQIVFHKDVIRKFDKHTAEFEHKRNFVKYDPYKEQCKLHLLESKKALLTQLVDVHTAEMRSAGQYVPPTHHHRAPSSSTPSVTTTSTGESWATFASRNSHSSRLQTGRVSSGAPRPKPNVPVLRLGALG